jgi:hypothetical protein
MVMAETAVSQPVRADLRMYFEQKESRVQWARIAGLDLQLPPVKFQL